jgi:uncharacterized protein (TIGR02145 family)
MLFAFTKMQAQHYQINFTGSGASSTVETIQVQNLTQGTSLNLSGSDVLNLTATVTGIEQIAKNGDHSLHIYPNPIIDKGSIEFEIPQASNVLIELYDITGKKVTSIEKSLQAGIQKCSVSGLNNGLYTVKVKSNNLIYSGKIIGNGISSGDANITFISSSVNEERAKLKSANSLVPMQYNTGDRILLKAFSGTYSTVKTLVPEASSTETFEFISATDFDGNNYGTVTIGSQIWMLENLKTTRYKDGTSIPEITDDSVWRVLSFPAYCNYNNSDSLVTRYGRLYNWYAVNTGKLAPEGWRVPTAIDWLTLSGFLGGGTIAGGKLKETGTSHWSSPNTDATNESGFTALPGGLRFDEGSFGFMNALDVWWSSDVDTLLRGINFYVGYIYSDAYLESYNKTGGFAIRCIKN